MRPVWVKISGGTPARLRVRFPPVGRSTETVHADTDARLHPQHTSGISAGAPREPSSRQRSGSRSRGNLDSSGHALRSLYNPNCEAFAALKEFLKGVVPRSCLHLDSDSPPTTMVWHFRPLASKLEIGTSTRVTERETHFTPERRKAAAERLAV